MDNVEFDVNDFYCAIKHLNLTIDDVNNLIVQINNIIYLLDANGIDDNNINNDAYLLKDKLIYINNKLLKIRNIFELNNLSSVNLIENEKIDNFGEDVNYNKNEIFDGLKGNNEDSGAKVGKGTSIFEKLKDKKITNKLLDNIKGNNKDSGALVSNNVSSIVGEMYG